MKLIISGFITLYSVLLFNAVFGEANNNLPPNDSMYSDRDTIIIPERFGFGRAAIADDINAWDIDIGPDGEGLPPGTGIIETGQTIYNTKCVVCHGIEGIGGVNGSLAISRDSTVKRREKVIGNHWSHATTIFDYVRRAMPFTQPGSLTNEEVYHLTAYLLFINQIIDEKDSINKEILKKIEMPAFKLYVRDDRRGGLDIR